MNVRSSFHWSQRAMLLGLAASSLLYVLPTRAQSAPPPDQTAAPAPAMPAPTSVDARQTNSVAARSSTDASASNSSTTSSAGVPVTGAQTCTQKANGKKVKAKKVKVKKEKKPKLTHVAIDNGILTVDGFTGKAAMNYDIADLQYLYIWAPGVGTAVISNHAFPRAKEQPAAFDGPVLTVTVDGHQLQLTSTKRLLGKKPASAWVLLDTSYIYPSRYPAVGYGSTVAEPFVWPGSRHSQANEKLAAAPPLPANLLPVQLPAACPPTGTKPAGCTTPTAAASAPAAPAPRVP